MNTLLSRERTPSLLKDRPGPTEGISLRDLRAEPLYLPCPHCRALGRENVDACRVCGYLIGKWGGQGLPHLPRREFPVAKPPSLPWEWKLRLGLFACLALGTLLAWLMSPAPLEIKQSQFQEKVLMAQAPVLVMFNVAPQCGCADEELVELSGQWKGKVAVVTLNAVDSPKLGAEYGVTNDPIVMLFDRGRLVKRADARAMEDAAKSGGPSMKARLEEFVGRV